MVRKALILALALFFIAALGFAQQNIVVPYVYKAAKPVVIDCNLKEWNFCYPIDFNRQAIPDSSRAWAWIPATDTVCSGRLFMMYDDAYFYFAANVRDDAPGHFSDAGWAATALEYYFSNKNIPGATRGDHTGMLDTLGVYDMQLNISFSAKKDSMIVHWYSANNSDRVLKWNRNNIKYKLWDAGDGYVVEGRIPWDTLKSPKGTPVKFVPGTRVAATWSLFHMDATELSGAFRGYQYPKNPPWQGPVNWQVIDVYGAPTAEWLKLGHFDFVKPYVHKAKKPVAIDCNLKEWNHCFPIDFNRQAIPDSSRAWAWIPATDTVCSGRLFMMYDDTYFYFAADVRDDAPGHFSDAGWAATALEYYFSNKNLPLSATAGDHTGMLDTLGVYDMQLNISFSAKKDSMIVHWYSANNSDRVLKWNRNNIKYKLWDAGDGYVVEGRIPWDTLKSPKGTPIKFVPGTNIACTWSLFHMDATELSGAFRGYQYATPATPPWAGTVGWNVIAVKDIALVGDNVLTKVEEIPTGVPTSFTLSPAYPNPFNPGTNIQYTLNNAGATSLKVYNVLGQVVMTLVNGEYQHAGTYRVNVDMSGSSSGLYFCVLEQGQNRVAQKMLLLK